MISLFGMVFEINNAAYRLNRKYLYYTMRGSS